jgi:hypothetical protein
MSLLGGCTDEPPAPAASTSAAPTGTAAPRSTATQEAARPVTGETLWLCRPGLADNPCEGGLDVTVISEDGTRREEPVHLAVDPPADCFYVYPTVSGARSDNAPLEVTDAEVFVARAQAAPFAQVCRLFAPVYRQITRLGLVSGALSSAEARDLAYGDVISAFNDYLNTQNGGRPFVLIGHSQGAINLVRLIQQEIDGDPALRVRLLSALLLGTTVSTGPGDPAGGSFVNVPACEDAEQSGCVVSYASYAGAPPPDGIFGRSTADRAALCVSPAQLLGRGERLAAVLPTAAIRGGPAMVAGAPTTAFVEVQGAVTGRCRSSSGFAWLDITIAADALADLPELTGRADPAWGLHRADVNLALGDLVDLVEAQGQAWRGRGGPSWDR